MAAVHCGYVDIMRSNGSWRELKVISELIGGIAYLVFTIWGFISFHWWQVLFAPLVAIIPVSFISKSIVIPQVYLLIGIIFCFIALI
jgi:hypothetical protein